MLCDFGDVLVLKEAQKHNCPIVSNDKQRDWKDDTHITHDLREWLRVRDGNGKGAVLVNFAFDSTGQFTPLLELQTPPLRPRCAPNSRRRTLPPGQAEPEMLQVARPIAWPAKLQTWGSKLVLSSTTHHLHFSRQGHSQQRRPPHQQLLPVDDIVGWGRQGSFKLVF